MGALSFARSGSRRLKSSSASTRLSPATKANLTARVLAPSVVHQACIDRYVGENAQEYEGPHQRVLYESSEIVTKVSWYTFWRT